MTHEQGNRERDLTPQKGSVETGDYLKPVSELVPLPPSRLQILVHRRRSPPEAALPPPQRRRTPSIAAKIHHAAENRMNLIPLDKLCY
jgi:hypothetical protein